MDQTVNSEDTEVTGHKYHTDNVRLIGKTGTAQYTLSSGRYSSGTYNNIRSFAGIFPKDNPKYIIYLSIKKFTSPSNKMGEVVKEVVESVATYKNLSEQESNEDISKIYEVPNFISQNTTEAEKVLKDANINYILIGSGDKIINQYPSKNTKVINTSKIFLLTNNNNYIMPDMTNWSSNEAITFANLIHLSYNINGYGKVNKTSIMAGEEINPELTLEISLGGSTNEKSRIEKNEED